MQISNDKNIQLKITKKNWRLGQLLMKILVSVCKIEKSPSTAMEYIAICKKKPAIHPYFR